MYIESVPNRNSPLACFPHIEGLRGVLKGGTVIPAERDALPWCAHCHTVTSPPFLAPAAGSVCTASLGPDGDSCRDLVLALIAGRILDPASKLATSRALSPATAASSLGEMLGLGARR